MNIVCVICSELLVPSNEVFHTPCGHIFHHICLIQWLERSKTCPQCRERTTESKIHRIYFNFSNNDSIVEDPSFLQSRIDNLTLQLQLRDQRINNLTEIKEKLDMQTAGLRKEVRKVESEINGKNSAIHALKEQIKFYKRECQDIDTYKKEIEQLKKKNEDLKNLQALLDSSIDEVDDIMAMTCDIDKLKTYIVIMKKNMNTDLQKKRELRDKVKTLQQELMRVSATSKSLSEERSKRRALEEQLIICESEKINLQNQLLVVQENLCKFASNINMPVEKQDSLKVQACDMKSVEINENTTMLDVTPRLKKDDSCIIIDSDSEITPENIKSQDFFSMKNYGMKRERSNSNLKVPSILAKKSKFHASNQKTNVGMTFDGFGGHAKYDKFPSPVSTSHIKKIKR
ncbi:E3 ubiquitin-protein ligase TRAIP isoform X1 [Cataglyphis hispanica]|uniref:E3 ubiquitin-protein ligase TRAIP isoform X1 n=1 Tax=Cataglyphis hispanica TaxID=1086592 RepID=UPI0021801D81|nr:E3 ubiquitin-protein ligase TRAIP isoform X1 [Cataglyphis hispanica]